MNILFVCTANISRSFLAEQLLNDEIDRLGLDHLSCSSAGIYALPDYPPDPWMVDFLNEQGKTVREHRSKPVTTNLVDWADLILVMERDHQRKILEQWPESKKKMHLLGEFISNEGIYDDIIDPYGRSPYHYRLAQGQISMAIQSLIEKRLLTSSKTDA